VTLSSGESSFKSLAFIRGGVETERSKAGRTAVIYDRMHGIFYRGKEKQISDRLSTTECMAFFIF
jgi:hypothetical protein